MRGAIRVKVDLMNYKTIAEFITAVQEIAGTTKDPDTAANLRAALIKLHGVTNK